MSTTKVAVEMPRSAVELVAHLSRQGVKLRADGEQLRLKAPPGVLTPETKAELSRLKAEILEFLTEVQDVTRVATDEPIRPVSRTGELPLSFAQERLWFIDRMDPGGATYNIFDAIRLRGRVRRLALEGSLSRIFARHEVLRTTFRSEDGRPCQVIAAPRPVVVPTVDLSRLHDSARSAEAGRLMDVEVHRGFDLSAGPLLRTVLIRHAEQDHILFFNMHHIVSDGWSTGILVEELATLYASLSADVPVALPQLPIQYADFAAWQRERLSGERLEAEMNFWRGVLQDLPDGLELPTDRPRQATRSARGATYRFRLPAPLSASARRFSRSQGHTPYMTLLAAFQALLFRYTQQADLVVGSPTANRTRREIEGLIGFFVNTLAIRTDLSENPSFGELAQRVQKNVVAAQDHQNLPFEKLVGELAPERDLSRTPIFQVMFVFQNAPVAAMKAPGLTLERLELAGATTKLDLTLSLADSEPEITAEVEYSTDLFDPSTIARMMGHFRRLLAGAVAEPERRLLELPLLPAGERHQVLHGWNDPPRTPGPVAAIHRQFEARAAEAPDAAAVVFEDQVLSYGALNRRANRLAHHLGELGVGPEVAVGVFLARSVEMAIGVLGVLKAGGAYVPLDPAYPEERLAYMLTEPGARVMVTLDRWSSRLRGTGVRAVCLDADRELLARCGAGDPRRDASAQSRAYVIYTSGSTGRPKGAVNSHGSLARFTRNYAAVSGHGPGDRHLLILSFAFDASLGGLFPTLATGATLVLHRAPSELSTRELRELFESRRITCADIPVTLWNQWVEELGIAGTRAILPALRYLVAGGEPAYRDRLEAWEEHTALPVPFVGAYGPTETTVAATVERTVGSSAIPPGLSRLPIGRPIPGVRLYLLDGDLEPVSVGAAGEVFLGGDHLTRGYLNHPVSTARKFVPSPFAAAGSRLYRTGDFARHLTDGRIEFMTRRDEQIKVRGFRVEPAEVESTLSGHPAVALAAVAAHDGGAGGKWLAAYVVPRPGQQPTARELRAYLSERLPPYMMPSAIVFLDDLPRNPASGKVDTQVLPVPERGLEGDGDVVAPRTPTEDVLVGIWAQVLELEALGVDDNFFELGGHSLLATKLMSRVEDAFRVEMPLRHLFENPTVAGLGRSIDAAREAGQGVTLPPLVAVPRDGRPLPVSYAQERMWLFEQMQPGTAIYNTYRAGHIWGPLDFLAAEATYNDVVRRHEVLRTSFEEGPDGPLQVIHPHRDEPLAVVDLESLTHERRLTEAFKLAMQDAELPIALDRAPLSRARLLRLGPEEHVFLLSIHHIAYDLWSGGVLLEEIERLYLANVHGHPAGLPELPIQYADFAAWQRQWLSGEAIERQLDYWRHQLDGIVDRPMEIPTDRPRPAEEEHLGHSIYPRISAESTEPLWDLAQRRGVTEYMIVLALFKVLLHRVSGHREVTVGTFMTNRNRSELEQILGYFDNTVVLRTDAAGDPSFTEFLDRVRETALGAYAHSHLPYETLAAALATHDPQPLFRVAFIFELNYPAMDRELAGLRVKPYNTHSGTAKFDLTLGFRDTPEGLIGELEYSTELLDNVTVSRWLEHLRTVLDEVVAAPERRLSELTLMTPAQHWQVLGEWNDTGMTAAGAERCLHELFEAQMERTPDVPALAYEERGLTYRQLDGHANRLARRLRSHGVGPEVVVGVLMERSLEMVVSLYGILKAGGAYLPLDPDLPSDRLAFLVAEAGAPVVLTQPGQQLPPDTGATVLALDAAFEAVAGESSERLASGAGADTLAYVIYTSGSTGRPKGVMNSHRGIVNRLLWMQQAYDLQADDRVLQKTPFSFDVSVWEFFWPLLVGARLVVARPGGHRDPAYLQSVIAEQAVTTIHFVPSMLQAFVEAADGESCGSLRRIIASGEALPFDLEQRCYEVLPAPLYNLYGPTEAAVDVTAWACAPASEPRGVPIGRPVSNTRIHLLDGVESVPLGVAGELHIGGVQVARGYVDRPALTAERFVPDALGSLAGGRLYRTGDLARSLAGGEVDFLGRLDHQIKIRGFRIELGEIEAVLASHEAVREAVVMMREGPSGDPHLAAYLTARANHAGSLDADDLRRHAAEALPGYMVPSFFVTLPDLPLTGNGKVDRRALLALDVGPEGSEGGYVAPRTPREELLAGLFAGVLGVPRVGAEDHFFELGGHSLLASRLLSRVRQTFEVELPVRSVFEAPTVAALAMTVETAKRTSIAPPPPLVPGPRTGELPLSFAQQRLWFIDQLEPGSSAYNLPVGLKMEGPLSIPVLARCLEELFRRHEVLRTVFAAEGGQGVQVIRPVAGVFLPVVDLEGLPAEAGDAVERELAEAEASLPFRLDADLPLRTTVLRRSPQEHTVLMTMHHIASDGWSMELLVQEISELYAAFGRGEPSPLPELPVQYADFARWQRSWLHGEVLEGELDWWRERLAGLPPVLELPIDRPRPPLGSFRGASRQVPLARELAEKVDALGRRQGATPFMVTLAGLLALLSRHSGQRDLAVGTPVAGRGRLEVEGLVGFFVNTLVLRGDLRGDPSFRELVARVRETVLAAHGHQDVPFERLVEELASERSLAHTPLFQVLFALDRAEGQHLTIPGLEVSTLGTGGGTAKFDLSVAIEGWGGDPVLEAEYRTELFDDTTLERLLRQLVRLLESGLDEADRPVSDLPLLGDAGRHQLLREWSLGEAPPPHSLDLSAFPSPDAIGTLRCGEDELEHGELAERSRRLARHLSRRGVGPEVAVGLFVERGAEMVVGLLGILEAGGVCVHLDPALPAERLERMLEESGVALLLSRQPLLSRLPAAAREVDRFCFDTDASLLEQDIPEPRVESFPEQSLAYVIFTSGSTGVPKGVGVSRGALTRHLEGLAAAFDLAAEDRVLQFSPLSFDVAFEQLLTPLAVGASVVMRGEEMWDFRELDRQIREQELTVADLPTGFWQQWLQEAATQDTLEASSLRLISVGGDTMPPAAVRQWLQSSESQRLVNAYGPTEGVITASGWEVPRRDPGPAVSIGRPLPDRRLAILGPGLTLAPPGVAGELCLGDPHLARGYMGRPGLTAEQFVPEPSADRPGRRLYRTGDLARWRPDGGIEHLGRDDHQVKVRGFRIELGEIEAALGKHVAVRDGAVMVREDRPGDRCLVAYVVPEPGFEPVWSQVREELSRVLPEYMLPAAFAVLESLPLTANGKVDRKALAEIVPAMTRQPGGPARDVAPRDDLERALCRIWSELLDLERVGVTEGFFQIGGHSLLAFQLVTRMSLELGLDVPLSVLFQNPTVEQLAAVLRGEGLPPRRQVLISVEPSGERIPFVCVHPVGGNVACYGELARHLGPGRPFYGIQLPDPEEVPLGSIEAQAAHYLEALKVQSPAGPYLLAGWSYGGAVAFEMARQLVAAGEPVAHLVLLDAHLPDDDEESERIDDALIREMFIDDLRGLSGLRLSTPVEEAGSPDPRGAFDLLAEAAEMPGITEADLRLLFEMFRTNLKRLAAYRPGRYAGRLTLVLPESSIGSNDPSSRWRQVAAGVDVLRVDGDHYSMLRAPRVEALAARLEAHLGESNRPVDGNDGPSTWEAPVE